MDRKTERTKHSERQRAWERDRHRDREREEWGALLRLGIRQNHKVSGYEKFPRHIYTEPRRTYAHKCVCVCVRMFFCMCVRVHVSTLEECDWKAEAVINPCTRVWAENPWEVHTCWWHTDPVQIFLYISSLGFMIVLVWRSEVTERGNHSGERYFLFSLLKWTKRGETARPQGIQAGSSSAGWEAVLKLDTLWLLRVYSGTLWCGSIWSYEPEWNSNMLHE